MLSDDTYRDLRKLADRYVGKQEAGMVEPSSLVQEAWMRLGRHPRERWESRAHFLAVVGCAMRQILVDRARRRCAAKRGGGRMDVSVSVGGLGNPVGEVDVVELHEVLSRMATADPRQARIVELRFFCGLTTQETAEVLGVSKTLVEGEWRHARAWLRKALG